MDATFHESDERLELYALDRLSDSDVIRIEEHLLICEMCRDKLDEAATFAFWTREELRKRPLLASPGRSGWFSWLDGNWMKPGLALGGALALVLAAIVVFHGGGSRLTPVAALQLTAMRGADVASVAPAQELDLTFGDAPSGASSLSVDLVDGNGVLVWNGAPRAYGSGVRVKIQKALGPGAYFARLYDSPGHLLHEYAFRVKK